MIKLIATDMDGTFLKKEGGLPEGTFELIDQLSAKGILFVVASGRQTHTLIKDFEPVKDKIAIIAENGAVVYYKGKETHTFTMDLQKAKEIVKDALTIDRTYAVLCCRDTAYYHSEKEEFVNAFKKYYYSHTYRPDFDQIDEEKVVKVALFHPEDINQTVAPLVNKNWSETFKVVVSGKNWVDVGLVEVNKGKALSYLKQELCIGQDEVMAFGDYFNDVEMLEEATYSYAMTHAPEGVKKHAKYRAELGYVIEVIRKEVLEKY